ncbi:MAG: FAD-binding oxidoreductase [Bdellovibrionales bacterium]|jgi:FAD/FMN-containing dehydrogenase|nr:FAD-binding oxidoreductase [Bdellovibrionales bacterium]
MKIKPVSFNNLENLVAHVTESSPTFFTASRTSTVIPYEKIDKYLMNYNLAELTLADISQLPSSLSMNSDGHLEVQGPVTWQEAKEFCNKYDREIMTSPTEELASILSGISTSATGERCFGFGTLRDQVQSINYLDWKGNFQSLSANKQLSDSKKFKSNLDLLKSYQESYHHFKLFKNAPFPRFENETDLMIGTEGQLGVITNAVIKTIPKTDVTYLFILLPKWEEDFTQHLEIFHKVQSFRDCIFSCELVDDNSLQVLDKEDRPGKHGQDLIFLEVLTSKFDFIFKELIEKLSSIPMENIFEISATKCRQLRMSIPRATFEVNSKMNVVKLGTDVQVQAYQFEQILVTYRRMAKEAGVKYNLFGHFGDAHLHFNFLPCVKDVDKCQKYFENLYSDVVKWKASPFAEHGVGLLKQKYIKYFYEAKHFELFKYLKQEMDPINQFFPMGFMSLKDSSL